MVNRTIAESILDCYNGSLDSLMPLFKKKQFSLYTISGHTGEEERQLSQFLTLATATSPPGKRAGPY